jgi:hypothetical protein
MSIKSNAFGRVELTGADAKKFKAQATYGRAKQAAKQSAIRGAAMASELRDSGTIKLKIRVPA